ATWGVGETGASGPTGNRYGDAPGHVCLAVAGPVERSLTLETASADRVANMSAFAGAALDLLLQAVRAAARAAQRRGVGGPCPTPAASTEVMVRPRAERMSSSASWPVRLAWSAIGLTSTTSSELSSPVSASISIARCASR